MKRELINILKSGEINEEILIKNASFISQVLNGLGAFSASGFYHNIDNVSFSITPNSTENSYDFVVSGSKSFMVNKNKAPSTQYPPTEINSLVRKDYVDDLIPSGIIVMWSGSSVPTGWTLCNGNNGAPNLIDKFIMGCDLGDINTTGGSADAIVTEHNHAFSGDAMSPHSHTVGAISSSQSGLVATNGYHYSGNITTSSVSAGIPTGSISTEGTNGTNANLPPFYKLAYIMKL